MPSRSGPHALLMGYALPSLLSTTSCSNHYKIATMVQSFTNHTKETIITTLLADKPNYILLNYLLETFVHFLLHRFIFQKDCLMQFITPVTYTKTTNRAKWQCTFRSTASKSCPPLLWEQSTMGTMLPMDCLDWQMLYNCLRYWLKPSSNKWMHKLIFEFDNWHGKTWPSFWKLVKN